MLFSFFAMTLYTLCSVRLDLNITVDFDGLSVCVLSECAHMFILVEIPSVSIFPSELGSVLPANQSLQKVPRICDLVLLRYLCQWWKVYVVRRL
jgi:hypothetical protein